MQFDLTKPDDALRFVRTVDYPYVASAIYPSEMAYFLYMCERTGIECIIESGRDQGYSTAVLGAYAELRGVRAISIDLEMDPRAAEACRRRLIRYPKLELLAGDGFRVMPRILKGEHRKIALLIDGPKLDHATYLSAASCAFGSVHLVAHHNVPYNDPVFDHFCRRFPNARRLEQSAVYASATFHDFREWEKSLTSGTHRDLEATTLLVSVLDKPGPDRRYLDGFTPRQSRVARYIFAWWKMGAPNPWFVKAPQWVLSVLRARLSSLGRVFQSTN